MTRKDYVAIAAVLNYQRANQEQQAALSGKHCSAEHKFSAYVVDAISRDIAEVMARDNPRFDRARFLKACGVQS